MLKRIYVAGPYTLGNPVVNMRNAVYTGERLRLKGFIPYVPHLNMLWEIICPLEYDEWMDLDHGWLEVCDAILRLPGESKGADREVAWCEANDIPVFYSIEQLVEARCLLSE